jgi:hypothetical protein
LTGLDPSVLQIKTKIVSCLTADSKPVKLEVNSTVILPALVFPAEAHEVTSSPTHSDHLFCSKRQGLGLVLFVKVTPILLSSKRFTSTSL